MKSRAGKLPTDAAAVRAERSSVGPGATGRTRRRLKKQPFVLTYLGPATSDGESRGGCSCSSCNCSCSSGSAKLERSRARADAATESEGDSADHLPGARRGQGEASGLRRAVAGALSFLVNQPSTVLSTSLPRRAPDAGAGPPPKPANTAEDSDTTTTTTTPSHADDQEEGGGGQTDGIKCYLFCGVLFLFSLSPLFGAYRSWSRTPSAAAVPTATAAEPVVMRGAAVVPVVTAPGYAGDMDRLPVSQLIIMALTCFLILALIYFSRASKLSTDNAEGLYDRWMWVKIFSLLLLVPFFTGTFSIGPSYGGAGRDEANSLVTFFADPLNAAVAIALLTAGILYLHNWYSRRQGVAPPPAPADGAPVQPGQHPQHGLRGPPCPAKVAPQFPGQVLHGFNPYQGPVQHGCPTIQIPDPGHPGAHRGGGRFSQGSYPAQVLR